MDTEIIDFEQLVGNLQAGVFRFMNSPSSKFIYLNDKFCKILGTSPKSISKLSVKDIFVNKKQFTELQKRLKDQGRVDNFEVELVGKDKRIVSCSFCAVRNKSKDKKKRYYDVVVDDISLRKNLEKGLLESKRLFETVFNNTAAAIIVADKDEKIVAWNPFVEKLFHMTKEELFNLPVREMYPAREYKKIRALRLKHKGMVSNIETKLYKGDKTQLDVNLSITILKDSDNQVMGSIGIIRNITQQKLVERKIKESENKIRIILDNSAAAITLTDEKGRIVSWNKYTEQLFGMKRKDLYYKPINILYPKEEWHKIHAENISKIGSKHHMETKIVTKEGREIDIDLSVNVLRDTNDDIIGSVGIMQDITEQKRIQEMLIQAKLAAEEANSAKSLFLANMSHEVRTPMNTILGMLDLTMETELNEEQRENLIVAKDASDNLLSLINDILDLSRVEAGKISLEEIEFHLHNVLKSVIKGLSVIARDKGLELALKIDPKVPEGLVGDPVRLRQILINLINNAVKFTHKGKVTTEIKVASKKSDYVMLLFNICDEGIGIPKQRLKHIFSAFTQADDSTTRRFGGTGLGLAISKKLVDLMGGRIWVESEEGKGSVFSFTAEFRTVSSAKVSSLASVDNDKDDEKDLEDVDLAGLRILVAEDNIVNQRIAVRMLEKSGWVIDVVENGKQVLDMIEKKPFDLILMDANMPVLDGLEATKIIRNNEKKTGKYIPIIALTARAMQEDKKEFLDAGMDGYVTKPIDRKGLIREITHYFKKGNKNGH